MLKMTEATELKVQSQLIGKEAFLLLNAQIGFDKDAPKEPYINGSVFAQNIYDLKAKGYDVTVKINSPGGNVMDALNITDAIITTKSNTHNIGVAASAAGVILVSGEKRFADEGTTLMAHATNGGGEALREIFSTNLKNVYDKRTKLSKDKITEIMTGSGMHWFDTSEMLANGMIDEVIPAKAKFEKPTTKNVLELYKVYNSITQNDQDMDFKELLKGVWPGKTDAEMVTNAMTLKTDNDALKVKNQALEAQIVTLNKTISDAGEVAKDLEAKNLIDSSVKDGKIKEESRASWMVMAKADFKAAKETLESIVKVKNKSAASIPNVEGKITKDETDTYAHMTKHNPAKLLEIMKSEPEKFEALLAEFEASPNKEIK